MSQMGPPAPMSRLEWLASMQAEPAPEVPKDDMAAALIPLYAGQAADLESTNDLLALNGRVPKGWENSGTRPVRTFEMDPLPGMKSEPGRMGWAMAERALVDKLTQGHPTARRVVPIVLALARMAFAANNWRQVHNIQGRLDDRSRIPPKLIPEYIPPEPSIPEWRDGR